LVAVAKYIYRCIVHQDIASFCTTKNGDERQQLDELKSVGIAAIAAPIGVTSAILAPPTALALRLVYKMGVTLYCEGYIVPKKPVTDTK